MARMAMALGFVAGAGTASLAWYLAKLREKRGWLSDKSLRLVGVDLGGTTCYVALADGLGTILSHVSQSLPADKSFDTVTKLIITLIRQTVQDGRCQLSCVAAIGIGCPGNLDCEKGVVINAANLNWENAPLAATIQQSLGRPTFLENDANNAVLAEWWAGAGAGDAIKHIVMFTLGTGVGGGVMSDNRLIRGATGMAGELGHAIIEPHVGNPKAGRLCENTGIHGILERYASAKAVGTRAHEELARGQQASTLATVEEVTAKDVFEHAASGDQLAQRLVDETAEYLAIAFVNACRHFDPQLIVVSGGMSLAGEALFKPLREHFARRWWKIQPLSNVKIVPACTGNDAGVLGAAAAAKLRLEQQQQQQSGASRCRG